MKKQKGDTPDLRDKLTTDMASKVEKLCKEQGHQASKALIKNNVNITIDNYIEDWYEVSLEAIELVDGGADFITDEEINDPEVVKEAKLRVIKSMYEERPPGIHEHIAECVIRDIGSDPHEAGSDDGETATGVPETEGPIEKAGDPAPGADRKKSTDKTTRKNKR